MLPQTRQSGLTIIEVLVTLSILTLVLTGVTSSIISSFDVAKSVQNSFVASGLAQEGIEIVRNIRDSGFLAGSPALVDGTYRVQWSDRSLSQLAGPLEAEPTLSQNTSGVIGYSPGKDTGFRRIVMLSGSAVEKTITVTVYWTERSVQKSLTTSTVFYDWY